LTHNSKNSHNFTSNGESGGEGKAGEEKGGEERRGEERRGEERGHIEERCTR